MSGRGPLAGALMQSLLKRFQPLMIRVAALICVAFVLMGQSADVRLLPLQIQMADMTLL